MDLYNLYRKFDKDKICLSYLGDFEDEITHNIIELSDFNIQNNNDLVKIKGRVSFLIAECFQNVVRHNVDMPGPKTGSEKFFQVNIFPDLVCLTSANPVDAETKKFITEKISQLNSLNEEQLKDLHQTLLGSGSINKKGGAGLGLIEMARKSRHPLRFFFKDIDDRSSEFFLTLEVINKKAGEPQTANHIQDIVENYYTLASRHILLLYKGDFTKESVNSINEMLQPNLLKTETIGPGKRAMLVILELIQNISKHGTSINGSKNGIFFIAFENGHYNVSSGNFIDNSNAQKIKERLGALQKLTVDEVEKQYKDVLFNEEISAAGNGSLGLLEISKLSKNKFDFSIHKIDEEISFLEINVKL